MKLLNSKIKVRTSTKWVITSIFLLGALSAGIFSCSDDDGTELGADGVEAQSAYFQLYYNETPGGRITYVNVSESIPEQTDLSKSIELGGGIYATSFGEHIYAINGNASTITKWQVDKSTLEPSVADIFSIASTGAAAPLQFGEFTTRTTVIASETQAFVANLFDGIILEWNPSTMEIVKVHNVDPVNVAGEGYYIDIFRGKVLEGGKVAWAIDHYPPETCCQLNFEENLPVLAVLDPATGEFSYKSDSRMPYGGMLATYVDGVYMSSSRYVGMIDTYFNMDRDSSHYLLKVNSNGDFDPSFELNMSDLADIGWGGNVFAVEGNQVLVDYFEFDTWATAFDDRWNFWGAVPARIKLINSQTNAIEDFAGFENYPGGAWPWSVVDGKQTYTGYKENGGDLLQQNSFDDIVTLTVATDGVAIEGFERLW
ncbi:MAG: hypothetical protein AAGC88_17025 [Bacteroidota bacterium]